MQAAPAEKAKEQQAGKKDFREMLKDERLGDQGSGKPGNRFQDQVTCQIGKILSHPRVEGPGRKALAAHVIREVNKRRIVIVDRVAAGVLVEEQGIAEQKVAKNKRADD